MSFPRYKGGPGLQRRMISVGEQHKQFSVEVFPVHLRLIDSRDWSEAVIRISKKVLSFELIMILLLMLFTCVVVSEVIMFLLDTITSDHRDILTTRRC